MWPPLFLKMSASADTGERISLSLQFVASFCWAIGALLAGPASAADILQFFAAVAWCLANFASAWSLCGDRCGGAGSGDRPGGSGKAREKEAVVEVEVA